MPRSAAVASSLPSLSTAATSTATTPMPASPRSGSSDQDEAQTASDEQPDVTEIANELKQEGELSSEVRVPADAIAVSGVPGRAEGGTMINYDDVLHGGPDCVHALPG